jgi:hypothetical protein
MWLEFYLDLEPLKWQDSAAFGGHVNGEDSTPLKSFISTA